MTDLPQPPPASADLQPEDVRAFWDFMKAHFRTSVINKRDALEMRLVGQALAVLGIQSREDFLANYTTTIGRRIYTAFEVGVPQPGWGLWGQLVVCVHEHQHVVQHDREGLAYEASYLASRGARARWEAEAYRSNLELQFWRYGTMPSPRALAGLLNGYGCRAEDVEVAAKALELAEVSIGAGAVLNEATHVAMGWLNAHLPHLRATGPG